MSPFDILVSWYTPELLTSRGANSRFKLEFGPQARLVRNLIVWPWLRNLCNVVRNIGLLFHIVAKLGNVDALEKIFIPSIPPRGDLEYRGPSMKICFPRSAFRLYSERHSRVSSEPADPRLFGRLWRGEDPIEFWAMAY
ncbi:hypothetical protein F5Y09DRAFT_351140 [Xylaria sp. FL1042]|nr:hypothetical protein F5Y09DRAFT_351140 [Xylaria sp. FL1042]